MRGLVWFDKATHGGPSQQNFRIVGNHPAETAFKLGISSLRLTRP